MPKRPYEPEVEAKIAEKKLKGESHDLLEALSLGIPEDFSEEKQDDLKKALHDSLFRLPSSTKALKKEILNNFDDYFQSFVQMTKDRSKIKRKQESFRTYEKSALLLQEDLSQPGSLEEILKNETNLLSNSDLRRKLFLLTESETDPAILEKIVSFYKTFPFRSLMKRVSLKDDLKAAKEVLNSCGFTAGKSSPIILFSMNILLEALFPHFQKLAASDDKQSFLEMSGYLERYLTLFHSKWHLEGQSPSPALFDAYYQLNEALMAMYLEGGCRWESSQTKSKESATSLTFFTTSQILVLLGNSNERVKKVLLEIDLNELLELEQPENGIFFSALLDLLARASLIQTENDNDLIQKLILVYYGIQLAQKGTNKKAQAILLDQAFKCKAYISNNPELKLKLHRCKFKATKKDISHLEKKLLKALKKEKKAEAKIREKSSKSEDLE